jgi:uncharacterized protein YdhG (YjbR/CyaY superfamily)
MTSKRGKIRVSKPAARTSRHLADEREVMRRICSVIHTAVPAATATTTYNIPVFGLNGHVILYLRAFTRHIRLYSPVRRNCALELAVAPHVRPDGSLQFPYDRPIPFELVGRIARSQAAKALSFGDPG